MRERAEIETVAPMPSVIRQRKGSRGDRQRLERARGACRGRFAQPSTRATFIPPTRLGGHGVPALSARGTDADRQVGRVGRVDRVGQVGRVGRVGQVGRGWSGVGRGELRGEIGGVHARGAWCDEDDTAGWATGRPDGGHEALHAATGRIRRTRFRQRRDAFQRERRGCPIDGGSAQPIDDDAPLFRVQGNRRRVTNNPRQRGEEGTRSGRRALRGPWPRATSASAMASSAIRGRSGCRPAAPVTVAGPRSRSTRYTTAPAPRPAATRAEPAGGYTDDAAADRRHAFARDARLGWDLAAAQCGNQRRHFHERPWLNRRVEPIGSSGRVSRPFTRSTIRQAARSEWAPCRA